MNKGFTLIELLGVVIILSLLMVLAMPKIVNSVKNSGDEVDNLTTELVINAAELLVDSYKDEYKKINGSKYCVPISDLVEEGYLKAPITLSNSNEDISKKKSVQVSYRDKYKYEIVDNKDCTPVTVFKAVDINTATYRTDNTTMTIGNIPEGNYEPGDEYIVQVNDTNSYHFYILSNNEDGTVNMIASKNLGLGGSLDAINCSWYGLAADTSYGPLTAYDFLSNNTSSWINIPIIKNFNYENETLYDEEGYKGIEVKQTSNNYLTVIKSANDEEKSYKNLRARLPKMQEALDAGCTNSGAIGEPICPLYLLDYLREHELVLGTHTSGLDTVDGYWLLASYSNKDTATSVSYTGFAGAGAGGTPTNSSDVGIRPVITVPKDYLQ